MLRVHGSFDKHLRNELRTAGKLVCAGTCAASSSEYSDNPAYAALMKQKYLEKKVEIDAE